MSESDSPGQLQDYSVDQAAGAIVLVLGAVASLLLVIWQSKCHCKMNLCYIFQCERRPPSEEEMEGLKDQAAKLKAGKDKKSASYKAPKSEVEYKEKKLNEDYQRQLNPSSETDNATLPPRPPVEPEPELLPPDNP
tara:strand:+ start:534 stop:941 length:408 start_codon:yes stop_codon:yes gene_type:complete